MTYTTCIDVTDGEGTSKLTFQVCIRPPRNPSGMHILILTATGDPETLLDRVQRLAFK